jgi:mRNA interferase RelE/StbE
MPNTYTAVLSKKAQKQLDKYTDDIAEPLFKAIILLENNPRPQGCKKLQGRSGYRIRVGNYRIIYEIIDNILIIDIITIGHRKEVYE